MAYDHVMIMYDHVIQTLGNAMLTSFIYCQAGLGLRVRLVYFKFWRAVTRDL